ncbi:uncharacterized protein LOC141639290 [Silene latifolia]|uniref:uncharacterized protein LOC141639290 n=1 Tax=Silene latifolia TaxID=37657 RepID=UPI003D76D6DF
MAHELTAKYTRVRLTPRFTSVMFTPMLKKTKAKVRHWANQYLSYAELLGHQYTPSLKKIHKICKDFFWGIEEGKRRLVFKGWNKLLPSWQEGGIDIKEAWGWNKYQLAKWIWKLLHKPDCLWATWTKHYVLKGADIWQVQSTITQSCVMRVQRQMLNPCCPAQRLGNFRLASCLIALGLDLHRCSGMHRTINDPMVLPKHAMTAALASQNGLPTINNLVKRGFILVNRSALCEHDTKDISHLFFRCAFSNQVWATLCEWLHMPTSLNTLHATMNWYKRYNKGRGPGKMLHRCTLSCCIYMIWTERNS